MRRSSWIPASVVIAAIGLLAAAQQEPASTRSSRGPIALVRVAMKPSVLGDGAFDAAEATRFRNAQPSLLRSDLVLLQALRMHNSRLKNLPLLRDEKDPAAWLADHLEIGYLDGDSELLSISLPGVDPNAAIEIVNTVVRSYLQEVVDNGINNERQEVQMLKTERAARDKALSNDADQMHKLGGGVSGKQYDLRMAQLKEVAEDQRLLARELRHLNLTASLESGDSNQKKVREQLEKDLADLQSQRKELQEELDTITCYNSEVEQLRRRIRHGESQLESLDAEIFRRELTLKLPPRVTLWMMAEVQ
jgi:hypothetical protein